MKNFLVLFLFTTFCVGAQDKTSLEKRVTEMYTCAVNGEHEKLVEYFHPKIFKIVPKEQFIASMKFKGDEFKTVILKTPPNFEFGKIKKIGTGYYCIVKFDRAMNFVLNNKVAKGDREMITDLYKNSSSSDTAIFDVKSNTVITKKRELLIGVYDSDTNGLWVFDAMPSKEISDQLGIK